MTTALTTPGTTGFAVPIKARRKSAAHRIALALVWLAVASSSIVFSEPAPVDALMIGLAVLLPLIGLTTWKQPLIGGAALWLLLAALCLFAASLARDMPESVMHTAVSMYLFLSSVLFATFVAKNPQAHTRLLFNAYLFAAMVAALLGIVGYFDLFPGAFQALTRYDRATALFKDPNVFGPFLVGGLLISLHQWLTRPLSRALWPVLSISVLTLALVLSFSRGAWAAAAVALGLYSYLYVATAKTNWDRLKLAGLIVLGSIAAGLVLAVALQSDAVVRLLEQRASLTQPYDEGANGRFGGQAKAIGLILENPLGLGAQMFTRFHHHEEVHNVYLSMFLNGGWVGGLLYLLLTVGTLYYGFKHALRPTRTQPLFLIAYAALAANLVEGVLIDSDHWRHVYMLLGIVWGLMAADRQRLRQPRIMTDLRPVLLNSLLLVPPSRRGPRILGRTQRPLTLHPVPALRFEPQRRPRPSGRIVRYDR